MSAGDAFDSEAPALAAIACAAGRVGGFSAD